jgi:hypothetical protein
MDDTAAYSMDQEIRREQLHRRELLGKLGTSEGAKAEEELGAGRGSGCPVAVQGDVNRDHTKWFFELAHGSPAVAERCNGEFTVSNQVAGALGDSDFTRLFALESYLDSPTSAVALGGPKEGTVPPSIVRCLQANPAMGSSFRKRGDADVFVADFRLKMTRLQRGATEQLEAVRELDLLLGDDPMKGLGPSAYLPATRDWFEAFRRAPACAESSRDRLSAKVSETRKALEEMLRLKDAKVDYALGRRQRAVEAALRLRVPGSTFDPGFTADQREAALDADAYFRLRDQQVREIASHVPWLTGSKMGSGSGKNYEPLLEFAKGSKGEEYSNLSLAEARRLLADPELLEKRVRAQFEENRRQLVEQYRVFARAGYCLQQGGEGCDGGHSLKKALEATPAARDVLPPTLGDGPEAQTLRNAACRQDLRTEKEEFDAFWNQVVVTGLLTVSPIGIEMALSRAAAAGLTRVTIAGRSLSFATARAVANRLSAGVFGGVDALYSVMGIGDAVRTCRDVLNNTLSATEGPADWRRPACAQGDSRDYALRLQALDKSSECRMSVMINGASAALPYVGLAFSKTKAVVGSSLARKNEFSPIPRNETKITETVTSPAHVRGPDDLRNPTSRSAASSVPLWRERDAFLRANLHRPSPAGIDNAAWMKIADRADTFSPTHIFFNFEQSILKFLNDKAFKDKDMPTALVNYWRESFHSRLAAANKKAGRDFVAYADYKSDRLAFPIDPGLAGPARAEAERQLREQVETAYVAACRDLEEQVNVLGARFHERPRGAVNWELGGWGYTADEAAAGARGARNLAEQVRAEGRPVGIVGFHERASELVGVFEDVRGLQRSLSSSLDARLLTRVGDTSYPSTDVIEIVRKTTGTNDAQVEQAIRVSLKKRLGAEVSPEQVKKLRAYVTEVANLVPDVRVAERVSMPMVASPHGTVSIDFSGQNSRNIFEAMTDVSRTAGPPGDVLAALRAGEARATAALDEAKEEVRRQVSSAMDVPGTELRFSGDDGIVYPPKELTTDDEKLRYLAKIFRMKVRPRVVFVNPRYQGSARLIPIEQQKKLVSQGESFEKAFYTRLAETYGEQTAKKLMLGVDVVQAVDGPVRIRLIAHSRSDEVMPDGRRLADVLDRIGLEVEAASTGDFDFELFEGSFRQ